MREWRRDVDVLVWSLLEMYTHLTPGKLFYKSLITCEKEETSKKGFLLHHRFRELVHEFSRRVCG